MTYRLLSFALRSLFFFIFSLVKQVDLCYCNNSKKPQNIETAGGYHEKNISCYFIIIDYLRRRGLRFKPKK